MADSSKTYDMVARSGTECELPEAWARLQVPADFFHAKVPKELVTALQENFTDGDLLESGAAKLAPIWRWR